jgi:parallel beta-helix repeat protein
MFKKLGLTVWLSIFCLSLFGQIEFEKKLQTQLIIAKDGAIIDLDEGHFFLTKSLSLDGKKNIRLRGKGIDKTILDFKTQKTGAEGLRISNCENVVLENFSVQNAKGDNIKTMHVTGITFRKMKAIWTGKPSQKNGGYAFYPVQCKNVVLDSCIAFGASDAGIYVGQSDGIVVKNCFATQNVAGIEIENSLNAEVFDNTVTQNTGGILVFDLPDLVQKKGGFIRVFNNKIYENNFSNFAPKGNIVAKVPKGTGILILATNHVEVFNNAITNNKSCGLGIISYFMTENPIKDSLYYPYPQNISVHHNTFERRSERATSEGRFGKIFWFKLKFGKNVPHIIYDGIIDKKQGNPQICISENTNASIANLDAENGFKNIDRNLEKFKCASIKQ